MARSKSAFFHKATLGARRGALHSDRKIHGVRVKKTGQRVPADVRPMVPLLQGLLIGFFGTGLYVAVDTYEPDRTVAFVLKCLAVMWGDAAVIHCTGLFGLGFF
jgi:hypothetical protein